MWLRLDEDAAETVRGLLVAAARMMWGALVVSLVLNTVGHWPADLSLSGAGGLLFHALGPIGAAATVHLIGVLLEAVEAVPIPENETADTEDEEEADASDETASSEPAASIEAPAAPAPTEVAATTVAAPAPVSEEAPRSTADQREEHRPTEPVKARADKGTRVPTAAKPAPKSVRQMSVDELAARLAELVSDESSPLTNESSINEMATELGCSWKRAKAANQVRTGATEVVLPGQLSVVQDPTEEKTAA